MTVELYPHQQVALEKIHNGCVLKGGVGTGKSRTAMAYFVTKECGGPGGLDEHGNLAPVLRPKDIYIITTARKRDSLDWEDEAAAFRISVVREFSLAGMVVKVDSWNNILRYTEVKDAFFIFDEQRLVGSGAWVKAFLKIAKSNRWIMLSATPGDTWMDYIPIFVANGYYKNRTEFLRTHVVYNNFSKFPKIDHYVETARLEKYRRSVLVEMPFIRHTVRHVENIMVSHDEAKFEKVYKDRWHIDEERPLKDVGEAHQVMRKVVNSDVSRLGAIMKLHEKHPRLIIFYSFDYELEMLRTLAGTLGVLSAEWNGHKHQQTPEGDTWVYLVQYMSGSEAWNCVTTDAMVFYSLQYSYKIQEQCMGRIDRLNTPYVDLHYYMLRSSALIDVGINKSLKLKKNFNEKEFLKWN